MNVANLIKIPAGKSSPCSTCTHTIVPGQMIFLRGKGYRYHSGVADHEGCLWDDRTGPSPWITWWQVDNLLKAIRGSKDIPTGDEQAQRVLGAMGKRLKERQTAIFNRDKDASLELGPDLLDGYRTVLKATGRYPQRLWAPVQKNGQPWRKPEAQTTPVQVITAEDLRKAWREKFGHRRQDASNG